MDQRRIADDAGKMLVDPRIPTAVAIGTIEVERVGAGFPVLFVNISEASDSLCRFPKGNVTQQSRTEPSAPIQMVS